MAASPQEVETTSIATIAQGVPEHAQSISSGRPARRAFSPRSTVSCILAVKDMARARHVHEPSPRLELTGEKPGDKFVSPGQRTEIALSRGPLGPARRRLARQCARIFERKSLARGER